MQPSAITDLPVLTDTQISSSFSFAYSKIKGRVLLIYKTTPSPLHPVSLSLLKKLNPFNCTACEEISAVSQVSLTAIAS